MFRPSQPSRTPATTPATTASDQPHRPSHRPRSAAPAARPSSGKNSSQLPPYASASAQVTTAIAASASRVFSDSRKVLWKERKATWM